jgi:hypothetical protein
VTQEQEQEREHYAAYVWRMMVDLEAMSVELLGKRDEPVIIQEGDAEGEGEVVVDPALTLGEAVAAATKDSELEGIKYDLMSLKERYGDKVVMRASDAEVMNALTGSYVRVRSRFLSEGIWLTRTLCSLHGCRRLCILRCSLSLEARNTA